MQPARILLFGIRCRFTNLVAQQLMQGSNRPAALILPGPGTIDVPLRVRTSRSLLPMASTPEDDTPPNLPTFQVGDLNAAGTQQLIDDIDPELILVACFPRLIPRTLYERANLGAFNIHPSLLPAHRGPDPLFWIMRNGGRSLGVTIHRLAGQYDTGAIAAHEQVAYIDGSRERDLEVRLASTAVRLAHMVIAAAADGTLTTRPQAERFASYESWPSEDDFAISSDRPVRDGWNFIRGVAERKVPIRVDTQAGPILVRDAIEFGRDQSNPNDDEPGLVTIEFSDGWLRARTIPGALD